LTKLLQKKTVQFFLTHVVQRNYLRRTRGENQPVTAEPVMLSTTVNSTQWHKLVCKTA